MHLLSDNCKLIKVVQINLCTIYIFLLQNQKLNKETMYMNINSDYFLGVLALHYQTPTPLCYYF